MSELNLIPRDHVESRRMRRWLRNFGIALATVVTAAAIGRGWIALRMAEERPIVDHMRQQVKLAIDRQSRMAELDTRKSAAEAQLATLRTLRDTGAWMSMYEAIDHAYNSKLWFDELVFARTLPADAPPPPTSNAAVGTPSEAPPQVRIGFEIKGHALDHGAVSDFMRTLGGQAGITTVRLTDTGLRKYSTIEVVDFSLAAAISQDRVRTP